MARLFVVPKQESRPPIDTEEIECDPLEVSGDVATDLETAIRAFAFLVEWVEEAGASGGLRICADAVRKFRQEREQ